MGPGKGWSFSNHALYGRGKTRSSNEGVLFRLWGREKSAVSVILSCTGASRLFSSKNVLSGRIAVWKGWNFSNRAPYRRGKSGRSSKEALFGRMGMAKGWSFSNPALYGRAITGSFSKDALFGPMEGGGGSIEFQKPCRTRAVQESELLQIRQTRAGSGEKFKEHAVYGRSKRDTFGNHAAR